MIEEEKLKRRHEVQKKYRETHKQKIKEHEKKFYEDSKHRARKYETNRLWRANNLERYRENARRSGRNQRIKIKKEILRLLGGKCANPYNFPHPDWCNSPECLQIDHVHGHGKQEKRKFNGHQDLGSNHYYRILNAIKNGSKNYQLLCANCNWIKRFKNNERGNGGRPPMSPEDWKAGRRITHA